MMHSFLILFLLMNVLNSCATAKPKTSIDAFEKLNEVNLGKTTVSEIKSIWGEAQKVNTEWSNLIYFNDQNIPWVYFVYDKSNSTILSASLTITTQDKLSQLDFVLEQLPSDDWKNKVINETKTDRIKISKYYCSLKRGIKINVNHLSGEVERIAWSRNPSCF